MFNLECSTTKQSKMTQTTTTINAAPVTDPAIMPTAGEAASNDGFSEDTCRVARLEIADCPAASITVHWYVPASESCTPCIVMTLLLVPTAALVPRVVSSLRQEYASTPAPLALHTSFASLFSNAVWLDTIWMISGGTIWNKAKSLTQSTGSKMSYSHASHPQLQICPPPPPPPPHFLTII